MTEFTVAPEQMVIEVKNKGLATYQFGSKTAKHHFCKNCGIYTFHETMSQPGHFRLNIGCIDGVNSLELSTEVFDGARI